MANWAGTEKYVLDLSAGLCKRGHSVTLACPGGSVLEGRAHQLGVPHTTLQVRSQNDWAQLPKFVRVLAGNCDVVHLHSAVDFLVPALAARIARIPAVIMTRHLPNPFASRHRAYICSVLLSDRTIAVSAFIRQVLLQSGVRGDRIETVLNGIEPVLAAPGARQRLRSEFGIPQDALLVAGAGRLRTEKGFDVLLRAVAELKRAGAPIYCVIFGAGIIHKELLALAQELEIASLIRLPGFRADVADLWAAADMAVVPSVWEDPLPYTALEAVSAGCPVVGSRVGGIPEIVTPECGLLVPAGDAGSLAAAIRLLANSPELRSRMAEAGRERGRHFTVDANVEGVERVYGNILSGPRSGENPATTAMHSWTPAAREEMHRVPQHGRQQ